VRLKLIYWTGYSLTRLISWPLFRPRISGCEHIPTDGGFILASNHISYYDPPLVGSWQRRELYFFAKKELFRNRFFGAAIRAANSLPVSRGVVDRQALKLAIDVVKAGFGLTMFPEGTRSRTEQFLSPRPGIGIIATRAGCPIVPTYIHGSNKLRECFWGRDKMSITYGAPLTAEWVLSQGTGKKAYQQIAARVMERIAELRYQVTGVK